MAAAAEGLGRSSTIQVDMAGEVNSTIFSLSKIDEYSQESYVAHSSSSIDFFSSHTTQIHLQLFWSRKLWLLILAIFSTVDSKQF